MQIAIFKDPVRTAL